MSLINNSIKKSIFIGSISALIFGFGLYSYKPELVVNNDDMKSINWFKLISLSFMIGIVITGSIFYIESNKHVEEIINKKKNFLFLDMKMNLDGII